jgi:hypothetical protein
MYLCFLEGGTPKGVSYEVLVLMGSLQVGPPSGMSHACGRS